MLVVADSSPIIALINIDYISVVPKLFQQVIIPPQVAAELAQPNKPVGVRQTDFWVTESLLAARLRLYQRQTGRGPIPGPGSVPE